MDSGIAHFPGFTQLRTILGRDISIFYKAVKEEFNRPAHIQVHPAAELAGGDAKQAFVFFACNLAGQLGLLFHQNARQFEWSVVAQKRTQDLCHAAALDPHVGVEKAP